MALSSLHSDLGHLNDSVILRKYTHAMRKLFISLALWAVTDGILYMKQSHDLRYDI